MERVDAKALGQIVDLLDEVGVMRRDRGVDLHADTVGLRQLDAADGLLEAAGLTAERVVTVCRGEIVALVPMTGIAPFSCA
jgi:hypothetical protein